MSPIQQHKEYYEEYWTKGRARYSGDAQGYAANFRNWMHRSLNGLSPRTILEVGCGDASFTKCLAEYSPDVTALDISAQQIAINARLYPDIAFIQHDVAGPLPFEDGVFDVIWCSEVLEHLFNPAFALRQMHRVMAPGGLLLVTVPYHGLLKNLLIALFKWDKHFAPTHPHVRFFTRNTLGQVTAAAGFQEIEITTCGMNKPLRDLFIATNFLLKARKR
jgi:2-polyprenyl-6-hydroxyphenyl methylase/3-demethylubiquinone-9 3-methyltransferase